MPRQTASQGQISGYIGEKLREIRWACCSGALWVHALDLCRALDWQRPTRILRKIEAHAKPAFALGVRANGGEQYLDRDGVEELFQRKTGGNRDAVYNLVWAKIYCDDSVHFEDDPPCAAGGFAEHSETEDEAEGEGSEPHDQPSAHAEEPPDEPSEESAPEPTLSPAEIAAMEAAEQGRLQTSLLRSQVLIARSGVLTEYRNADGDAHHPDFLAAREELHSEMRRPYPAEYISVMEYVHQMGYPEKAARLIASTFGEDLKRVYRAERKEDPPSYSAIFPGTTKGVSVYHRFRDAELLASCWRIFIANRPWYRERWQDSHQRQVDAERLEQMRRRESGLPSRGWRERPQQSSAQRCLQAPLF